MKALFSSIKLVSLRKFVTVTLFAVLLIVTTACASVDTQAANPNSQPVQMGGANNPYKGGGDKFTRNEKGGSQASLKTDSQRIATRENELLYPGAETPAGRKQKEAEMPIITEKDIQPKPGGLIQREESVGERVKDRLETVKESVKDASSFLGEKADEASARPEVQKNPAVGK
ncbi:hypothetical protein NIES4071_71210 [Calothrix sp. NIES-4071]|nr:hypothetical protein NIES4071_71210 [Calothrix sp. NIES-4071]BAZ61396.1 hypothetical protein NIES4105_71160 [Calothrix sp. NIES-4105]